MHIFVASFLLDTVLSGCLLHPLSFIVFLVVGLSSIASALGHFDSSLLVLLLWPSLKNLGCWGKLGCWAASASGHWATGLVTTGYGHH